jgi:hypothetical protein
MSGAQTRPPVDDERLRHEVERAVERVLGTKVARDAILMASGLDSLGSEELLAELSKLGTIRLPGAFQLALTGAPRAGRASLAACVKSWN